MKKTNKKLKIILPVAISFLALLVVLLVILIPKPISQNNYFNSLSKSNFTKQVQNTTIKENETLVYEKIETIVFDGEKVYHKIEEKTISSSPSKLYDEITTEYFYTKSKMYYFEENTWKMQDFNIQNSLKTYNLKTEYFVSFTFDKEIETQGTLSGIVKNENINDVFNSETNFKDALITIIVNKNFKINSCEITAKTAANRDVLITNEFTYNQEKVILPNI